MPELSKAILSQFIRTECYRQLRLSLSPDNAAFRHERNNDGMPAPQPPRPGLQAITAAGREWESEKLGELHRTFGAGHIKASVVVRPTGVRVFQAADFIGLINGAVAGDFLVQARYEIGPAFERSLGIAHLRAAHTLSYQRVIPDIIAVRAAETFETRIDPVGDVHFLASGDQRLQLQVIDIKLTAEPSPGYFTEIAYYSMVFAGWLIDSGLDGQFVVVPDGAVWPGSHDLSALTQCVQEAAAAGTIPTDADLAQALGSELELIPFEVFAYRVRRFLQIELPDVLGRPWQTLLWHVDNRCKGCEYLGHPWINQAGQQTALPEHCIPEAERIGQLSRVAFISRGRSERTRGQRGRGRANTRWTCSGRAGF